MTPHDRRYTLAAIIPEAAAEFRWLLEAARAAGWQPAIVSAVRTCAEQAGTASTTDRTWHFFGQALDVELRAGAGGADRYRVLGEAWEARGHVWGGRWTEAYPDAPGVPGAQGDVMHFHIGPETVPESVLPHAVTDCAEVDRIATAYRRAAGGLVDDDGHGLHSVRVLRVGQDWARPSRAAALTVGAGVALGVFGGLLGVLVGKAA